MNSQPRFDQVTRFLLIILVIGALLRLVALGRWSLWFDEIYGLNVAQTYTLQSSSAPPNQHPPLYHLALQQLVHVSTSETWLRLPSALAGILALLFIWESGVAYQGRRLGLVATALAAFSPLLVWYGREARMYGPAIGAWAISIYYYIQSFRRSHWIDAIGLSAANLIALYLTYSSFGLWFGEMALFPLFWYANEQRRQQLVHWIIAQAVIAAGFAAWWPYLQLQMNRSTTFYWQLPFFDLSGTLAETFQRALTLGAALVLITMLVSLLIASRPRWRRAFERLVPLVAVAAVLAYLVVLIVGAVPRGLSIRRQVLVFLIPLIMFAAWGFQHIPWRWLVPAVVTFSLGLSVYTVTSPAYEDWDGALHFVASHREDGDLLFVYPPWLRLVVDYYYPGGIKAVALLPEADLPTDDVPFPPGSDIWVVLNAHPTLAAEANRISQRMAEMGELELSRMFPRYIEVRRYRIGQPADSDP